MKKTVYVCSPLRGDIKTNIEKAKEFMKTVVTFGHVPIAPHVMFDGLFDDEKPREREVALDMGQSLLKQCDELWVFTKEISEGMQGEIDFAKRNDINVYHVEQYGFKEF